MEPDYSDSHYDVLVIGSGFGGSVTALRLTEKGYRVGVLEAGRRFADEEFAETSWNLRKFLWAPRLGCYGIQRIHLLRNVMILAGAGVGGGSLNYANTLYVPPEPFFDDRQWAHITDWRAELMPHYEQAQRMLGVVTNPTFTDADRIMKEVADDMGVGDTFVPTPVGVFFGPDGTKAPGKAGARPVLRRCGPGAHRLHRVRRVHDGMPLRRQEHLAEELPRPGGIRWGASASDDDGDGVRTAFRRALGGRHRPHRTDVAAQAKDVHRHASGAGGRHVRHPEAAASRCATAACCPGCPPGWGYSPAPTPNRSSAPGDWKPGLISTSPTAWPSPPRSIRRPTPTSNRCATARVPTRWVCCRR